MDSMHKGHHSSAGTQKATTNNQGNVPNFVRGDYVGQGQMRNSQEFGSKFTNDSALTRRKKAPNRPDQRLIKSNSSQVATNKVSDRNSLSGREREQLKMLFMGAAVNEDSAAAVPSLNIDFVQK